MEQDNKTEYIYNNICNRCLYIFKNIIKINNAKTDVADSEDTKFLIKQEKEFKDKNLKNESNLNINEIGNYSNHNNFLCKFCLGILDEKRYEKIIEMIKIQIKEFESEHQNFKLTTNFSALFLMIHTYLKQNFQRENLNEIKTYMNPCNIDYLDINLIRKIFKPVFLPSLCQALNKESAAKSTLEIKIIFEFKDEFYQEIYKAFASNSEMRGIGEKRFKPNLGVTNQSYSLDRGNINNIIKGCSSDLYYEIFGKVCKEYLSINDILEIRVDSVNENILLKGNYLKFSREIGQTPWSTNGQKVCFSSVQEEMGKIFNKTFEATDSILHAGGREDRDVRMLGSGRPFIIELVNPKKRIIPLQKIQEVQEELNNNTNLIRVENLGECDQKYFDDIKQFETSKRKYYTCVVWTKKIIENSDIEKINSIRDMEIIQKTPLRVMHRRTLMDRKKMILKLDAKIVNEHIMIINVLSSAGTYIKEFIHSDLGRTNPSLPSILGCDCDIMQLDVMNIIYEN